ncbi:MULTISPECIES: isochorismatase family protein [Pseudomonas]|uniref:Isochorismatase n=1 Tax=Pseudomonas cedrina TaxID=651740 RepID=A0A2S9D3L1_PSECE|nr:MULTISPECIES: isochorismatase family protein [Pseudomonas]AVJ24085.1 isochorismatase [Pseudomonas sp. MYb193]PRB87677.1 isochorismatase [Pseudomonas cedrina]
MKMFTAADSVLLLIDHQVGTMKLIQTLPFEVVKRNTLALAKAAKELGVPIVLTTGTETQFQGPLLPEFKELFPEEYEARIARGGIVNTWSDPIFRDAVLKTNRRNLIMAGATTDVCVMPPAISARQDGFQVQVVLDASGSPYEYSEEAARLRMVQEGVTLTATNTMIAELAQDWSRPEVGKVLQIMKHEVLPQVF